jgi:UDP-N-acetylglucosamine 2-epimerase (non-hydrolysing)
MKANQSLAGLTARAIEAIDRYLEVESPDFLVMQGDTTTAFCAALAGFYQKIPVGHVEAGLRTGNLQAPWPEEANRVLATRLATLHFAPTQGARENLLREGIPDDKINMTGNTVIDALLHTSKTVKSIPPVIPELPECIQPEIGDRSDAPRLVLITGHRRENFGQGFENICHAIFKLAQRFPDVHFVYPVHLNPNVREPVMRILNNYDGESTATNIHLIEPLAYLPFVAMMNRATLILTDSGGVQEEAPSLGKPVLVMRDSTERPEAVDAGTARLVGTDCDKIFTAVAELLTDQDVYRTMSRAHNPYGDGMSAERIVRVLHNYIKAGLGA